MDSSLKSFKAHVVNKKTGYCYTCQSYDHPHSLNSINPISPVSSNLITSQNNTENAFIKYKLYDLFDCFKGRLGKRIKLCSIIETLYYVPMWIIALILFTYITIITLSLYFGIQYSLSSQLVNYNGDCTVKSCDIKKGLYCRKQNSSLSDYCNCPMNVQANRCDCATSYYWNGVQCKSVYGYGQGPCLGDYSCYRGLVCDRETSTCKCPSSQPKWDSVSMTCWYKYMGCYSACTSTPCDYSDDDRQIETQDNSYTYLELDDCLSLCEYSNKKYALIHLYSNFPTRTRCTCINTFITYMTQLPDTSCSTECSYNAHSGPKLCPDTGTGFRIISVFQIGSD